MSDEMPKSMDIGMRLITKLKNRCRGLKLLKALCVTELGATLDDDGSHCETHRVQKLSHI